tara:strand:+ start:84 stop:545 length:462 start_codon:yes stop_codon:yes gene_type:complete
MKRFKILAMAMIPEELKNSKCCLKCKLVDPDFTTKEMNLGSSGNKKTFFKCKTCKSNLLVYNEIIVSKNSFMFMVVLIIAFIHITGYFDAISISEQLVADTIVIILFWFAYLYNNARKLRVAGFLKEYAENNGYIVKQESRKQTDDNNSNLRY